MGGAEVRVGGCGYGSGGWGGGGRRRRRRYGCGWPGWRRVCARFSHLPLRAPRSGPVGGIAALSARVRRRRRHNRCRSSAPQQVCVLAVFGTATSHSLSGDRVSPSPLSLPPPPPHRRRRHRRGRRRYSHHWLARHRENVIGSHPTYERTNVPST